MKYLIFFVLICSALMNLSHAKSGPSDPKNPPFILRFKELNLRKKIREMVGQQRKVEDMKKRVERILAYSEFGPHHWWTYSQDSGECTDSQMELKEYLNFLKDEKNPYSVRENKRASYYMISVREKEESREEVTFWTRDRYQCEMNKHHYRSVAQSK